MKASRLHHARRYAYSGLTIASEIAIPEWTAFETPAHDSRVPPDVTIRLHDPAVSSLAHREVLVDGDRCRFYFRDAGEYVVTGGIDVLIVPAPGAAAAEIRLFLLGTVLGVIAYQRRLLFLHMSVVAGAGAAVGFCGASKAGKSTLTAMLCQRGYEFVADDLCRCQIDGTNAVVYPATPRLKLWQDALASMHIGTSGLERDHFRNDKFHAPARHRDPARPVRLRAIYVLEWGEPGVRALSGVDGVKQLATNGCYRADLAAAIGGFAEHWMRCQGLAAAVPILAFSRRQHLEKRDAELPALISHIEHSFGIIPAPSALPAWPLR